MPRDRVRGSFSFKVCMVYPIENAAPALLSPDNQKLLDHWIALRGSEPLPRRSHFDPMAIPAFLPYTVMLEPTAPGVALIRTFGSELVRRLGLDPTGENLLTLYPPDESADIASYWEQLVSEKLVGASQTQWSTTSGYQVTSENLWLPFLGDDGTITRVLGSIREITEEMAPTEDLGGSVSNAHRASQRGCYRF